MIISDIIVIKGKEYKRTTSTNKKKLIRAETGEILNVAIDTLDKRYVYHEVDIVREDKVEPQAWEY